MLVMMKSLPLLVNSPPRHLVPLPLLEEVMGNKATLLDYRISQMLLCACCLGKNMQKEECIFSPGKAVLCVQDQTPPRQMNGLKM